MVAFPYSCPMPCLLLLCILCLCLAWFYSRNEGVIEGFKHNEDILTEGEKKELNLIMSRILRHLRERNVTYFAAFGTLIGCVRHGGRMTWDDDIDMVISHRAIGELLADLPVIARGRTYRDYALGEDIIIKYKSWGVPLKVYNRNSVYPKYPFVDLYTYKTITRYPPDNLENPNSSNAGEVVVTIPPKQMKYGHIQKFEEPYRNIFPLKFARFDSFTLSIPHGYEAMLQNQYGEDVLDNCVVSFNHKPYCKVEPDAHGCVSRDINEHIPVSLVDNVNPQIWI